MMRQRKYLVVKMHLNLLKLKWISLSDNISNLVHVGVLYYYYSLQVIYNTLKC